MNIFNRVFIGLVSIFLLASLSFAQRIEVEADDVAEPNARLSVLFAALNSGAATADSVILVTSGGHYGLPNDSIFVPMVIKGAKGLAAKPEIRPNADYEFANEWIKHRNDLRLENLIINGTTALTTTLDSVRRVFNLRDTEVSVAPNAPNNEPDLYMNGVDVMNIYNNADPELSNDGKFYEFETRSSAGVIDVQNCTFTNIVDETFNAGNTHKADHVNTVTVEHGGSFSSFTLRNSTFNNCTHAAIKLNGDPDSTTQEPGGVTLENLTFYKCARRVIWLRDLDFTTVRNILIVNSVKGIENFSGTGELMRVERENSVVSHIDTFFIEGVKADGDTVILDDPTFRMEGGNYSGATGKPTFLEETVYNFDPGFADPDNGDFTITSSSPVWGLGHDGGPLGDRNWTDYVSAIEDGEVQPNAFNLKQNYPNPFNPSTTIAFDLAKKSNVKLTIYDITGQVVATLLNGSKNAGSHEVVWNAAATQASGIYMYELKTNDAKVVKKMTLIK